MPSKPSMLSNPGTKFTSVGSVVERNRGNLGSSVQQFPQKLAAHAILLTFKKYQYEKPGSRQLNKATSSTLSTANLASSDNIMLPLPTEMDDQFAVGYGTNNQNLMGEGISSAAKALNEMQSYTSNDFKNALKSAFPEYDPSKLNSADFSKNFESAAKYLGRRGLASYIPGSEVPVDIGLGSTANPKQALYFSGMDLRHHNFSWTFAPRNSTESDVLRNIGNTIKRNILPSYGNVGGLNNKLLLNYPSVVDIYFFGIDQSYFQYYKTCVVDAFKINYAPNGLAIVEGGKPAAVTMEMSITEMDIHTSEDYYGNSTSEGLVEDTRR